MTLETTRHLAAAAHRGGAALLAFNVITLEHAEGIVAGAARAMPLSPAPSPTT